MYLQNKSSLFPLTGYLNPSSYPLRTIRVGFNYFFSEAGIVAPQVGIKEIIKYFINIVVLKYVIPLFIT